MSLIYMTKNVKQQQQISRVDLVVNKTEIHMYISNLW